MADWSELRKDFGVAQTCIYLDNGSKVPLAAPVLKGVRAFEDTCRLYGRAYGDWWDMADETRGQVAALIGAEASEIAYADSSTHAINLIAQGLSWKAGDNVVVFKEEFPSNLYPWLFLRERGVEVRLAECRDTREIGPENYESLCDGRTRLIAVSHIQAGNGYRLDLEELGEFCSGRGILFFVDATQSCGAFSIDVERMKIDFLCASTYKWLMGMDGLAVLYCRKSRLAQVGFSYLGWSGRTDRNDYEHHGMDYPEEARRFELGNLNYTAITALHHALLYRGRIGTGEIEARTAELTEYLKAGLRRIEGVLIEGDFGKENSGAIVTVQCPEWRAVYGGLSEDGIAATLRYNGIRFSPYFYNACEEIDRALELFDRRIRRQHG